MSQADLVESLSLDTDFIPLTMGLYEGRFGIALGVVRVLFGGCLGVVVGVVWGLFWGRCGWCSGVA